MTRTVLFADAQALGLSPELSLVDVSELTLVIWGTSVPPFAPSFTIQLQDVANDFTEIDSIKLQDTRLSGYALTGQIQINSAMPRVLYLKLPPGVYKSITLNLNAYSGGKANAVAYTQ